MYAIRTHAYVDAYAVLHHSKKNHADVNDAHHTHVYGYVLAPHEYANVHVVLSDES